MYLHLSIRWLVTSPDHQYRSLQGEGQIVFPLPEGSITCTRKYGGRRSASDKVKLYMSAWNHFVLRYSATSECIKRDILGELINVVCWRALNIQILCWLNYVDWKRWHISSVSGVFSFIFWKSPPDLGVLDASNCTSWINEWRNLLICQLVTISTMLITIANPSYAFQS